MTTRFADFRLELAGTLVCRTPLHVGGLGADPDSDMPLARDGRGRLVIPGTSLAGALRDWCRREFEGTLVDAVWGFLDEKRPEVGHASRLVVADAVIAEKYAGRAELRDGVGIDRQSGTAAVRFKYDRVVLPRGTEIPFALTVEDVAAKRDAAVGVLLALADALERGDVRLGASTTRGLGSVLLRDKTWREFTGLRTRAGILARLRGLGSATPTAPRPPANPVTAAPRLRVTIDWEPVGPVMVKSGADGTGIDMLPLMSGVDDQLAPVLPGSSVKGAMRARAETIVRTLLNIETGDDFLAALDVPLVDALFGTRGLSQREQAGRGDLHLGRAALAVDDCYAVNTLSTPCWQAVTGADRDRETNDDSAVAATVAAVVPDWRVAHHVAIDRWTGGAADSLLYSVLEPHGVTWEPFRFTLDLNRIAVESERGPAFALFLLVVRDLVAGRLPVGFAVNRGFGEIRVTRVVISGGGSQYDADLPGGDVSRFAAAFDADWQKWLASQTQRPEVSR